MRTVVITGANTGLGFQTALSLAQMGERIVMACRSVERARQAQRDLLADVPNADTIVLPLDVSEPASIREFGEEFSDRIGRLDLLINNAGIAGGALTRNSVGHELQLATNHLGAFALVGTLLPFFRDDAPARIVNVGSLAHRLAKLDLDDVNWEKTRYNEWRAYARSKLALLSFTLELSRRLQRNGSHVVALAAHPGMAATEIAKGHAMVEPRSSFGKWLNRRIEPFIPLAADAAMPILHAACAKDVAGGDYFGPSRVLETRGTTGRASVNPIARDVDLARQLWTSSESMTGVRYLSEAGGETGA